MAWNGLSRVGYSLGLMLVLLPLTEGRLPWLRNFMSFAPFQVLGKLTYSAYLLHIAVIDCYIYSAN